MGHEGPHCSHPILAGPGGEIKEEDIPDQQLAGLVELWWKVGQSRGTGLFLEEIRSALSGEVAA
jgi:hypothetical protein